MSALQLLGAALLAVTFLGGFALTVRSDGWTEALMAWGFAAVVTATVAFGALLLTGDLS